MRVSFSIWVLLALSAASPAYAQAESAGAAPQICLAASDQKLADLEARKRQLERDIVANPNSRKAREELLEVMFRIECARKVEPQAPTEFARRSVAPRAAPPPPAEVVEVTTYYATNRKETRGAEPVKVYGNVGDNDLHYGRAVVSVPLNRPPGTVTLPSLWKLEREADPRKHFILRSVTPLGMDATLKEMGAKLRGISTKALLVFVHGYNTTFDEAAMRTAQIAHDLQFPGLAMFYSWPSAGSVVRYWQDEETARLSEEVFEQVLEDIAKLPASDIYVVGHSMGNRVVGHALQSQADKGRTPKNLREVVLAAPDVSVEIFRSRIAPRLAAMRGTRTTIYASSSDIALKASKVVHGFRRVGETDGEVFTYPGLETVDATNASSAARAYGHLYIVDSPSVLKDIRFLIGRKVQAGLRGLSQVGTTPNLYWRLP